MVKKVELKVIDPRLELPKYAKPGDAGMDVRASLEHEGEIVVYPGIAELVPLGFAMWINDPYTMGALVPRSGSGHKQGLVLGNLIGTIDSDYTGQVYASVWNRNLDRPISIKDKERIAQLVFLPIHRVEWDVVEEFSDNTERGAGGFGHSGFS